MTAMLNKSHTPFLDEQITDERFLKPSFSIPLIFLIMFVIFIYGALLVGLLGVADWIIHAWQIGFLLNMGNFGIFLLAVALPACWAVIAALSAYITYWILSAKGCYILAQKTATVIIFAMFHIFALPWILWPMVRRASPKLQKKHIQKLRQMVLDGKMQKHLEERRNKLIKSGYIFK